MQRKVWNFFYRKLNSKIGSKISTGRKFFDSGKNERFSKAL